MPRHVARAKPRRHAARRPLGRRTGRGRLRPGLDPKRAGLSRRPAGRPQRPPHQPTRRPDRHQQPSDRNRKVSGPVLRASARPRPRPARRSRRGRCGRAPAATPGHPRAIGRCPTRSMHPPLNPDTLRLAHPGDPQPDQRKRPPRAAQRPPKERGALDNASALTISNATTRPISQYPGLGPVSRPDIRQQKLRQREPHDLCVNTPNSPKVGDSITNRRRRAQR